MADARQGLRYSVGTFTVFPVGDLGPLTPGVARWAMLTAPIAALPLGVLVAALLSGGHSLVMPPLALGFVVVGAVALATRAMHLDGLADTVDGFGAGWSRERALAVMKKGDVGPMGLTAVVVCLGIEASCCGALGSAPLVAGAAVVTGRAACTALAIDRLGPARADGLGAPMVGSLSPTDVVVTWLGCAGLLVAASAMSGVDAHGWTCVVGAAFAAVTAAAIVTAWLAQRATRIIGGITGDIFGAGVELATATLLIVLSARIWW